MKVKLKNTEEKQENPYATVEGEALTQQVQMIENELDNFMIYIFEEFKYQILDSYFDKRIYTTEGHEINEFFDDELFKFIQIIRKNPEIKLPFAVIMWYLMNSTTDADIKKRKSRIAVALMARMTDTYKYVTRFYEAKDEETKKKLTLRGLYGQEAKKNLRNLFQYL
jgi:hypothetical protein